MNTTNSIHQEYRIFFDRYDHSYEFILILIHERKKKKDF